MRMVHAALLLVVSASSALAQRAPVIVIPGRPDVPVLMNGVDVSWSVIEGEFGLDRPGAVTPTVIYRPFAVVVPYYVPAAYGPSYFPKTGHRPGYGRLEIAPPPDRPLPPPAPSFRQGWSSQSALGPANYLPPYPAPSGSSFNGLQPGNSFNGSSDDPAANGSPQESGFSGLQTGPFSDRMPAAGPISGTRFDQPVNAPLLRRRFNPQNKAGWVRPVHYRPEAQKHGQR